MWSFCASGAARPISSTTPIISRTCCRHIIDTRRRSGAGEDDLLARLLVAHDPETGGQMSDRQLRDEVMTLFFAGHETTGLALTWTWYLLATHPEVAARVRGELAAVLQGRAPTVQDLPYLRYTRMVIQETLRLYPPAWILSRAPIADDVIGGYPIPAGTTVLLSPYVTHRHPRWWAHPDLFDPERFAPERVTDRPALPISPSRVDDIGVTFAMRFWILGLTAI
jgi:cytochrome P450